MKTYGFPCKPNEKMTTSIITKHYTQKEVDMVNLYLSRLPFLEEKAWEPISPILVYPNPKKEAFLFEVKALDAVEGIYLGKLHTFTKGVEGEEEWLCRVDVEKGEWKPILNLLGWKGRRRL